MPVKFSETFNLIVSSAYLTFIKLLKNLGTWAIQQKYDMYTHFII